MSLQDKFWEHKSLADMDQAEWEAICDGCAKCCLNKFIDDDAELAPTDELHEGEVVHYSNIACRYLNAHKCECTQYDQRTILVPDCIELTKENLADIFFMPTSCSYRRLHEGRGLPSWHPLLNNGKKSLMHKKQMSVRNKTISEAQVDLNDFEDYIVRWPLNDLD
ncbi:YcgN family cysteine cluster protein [Alkalimonas collagenimarina]|uniref:YcgN family cysteine cluster protein n=1 Tax=Alkalimonas collagenimarina TaxID=400390 RepID=A0ABT9GUE4_9GAMM|nr:YcgN family cysteine cluster protein [Alkalimonas collagenimarina]MDP4534676.1 YcgN family cysteine cluster protein [Alkalimonas collagenimarina]